MKKYLAIVVLVLTLSFSSSAFASYTISVGTVYYNDTFTPTCGTDLSHYQIVVGGNSTPLVACGTSFNFASYYASSGNENFSWSALNSNMEFVHFKAWYSGGTLSGSNFYFAILAGGAPVPTCSDGIQNQDETGIDTGGVCTPPPAIVHGLALFSATNTHAITGADFVGQTASVVQTTIFGISPIIAIVAGLILAFVVVRFLINLFKETDTKKSESYIGYERRGYHSDGKGGVIKN